MKKILIIGSGGAGKSTTAVTLGRILNLPVIHLDSFYWKPNWEETSKQEWKLIIKKLCSKPSWIMDGNYGGTIDLRIQKADTIIFLYINRFICLWRVIKRRLFKKRVDLIPGCKEKIDFKFIKWVWGYNKTRAPKILMKLKKIKQKKIFIFRNQRQLKEFIAQIANKNL